MRRVFLLNALLTVTAGVLFLLGPARLEQLPAPVELPWPLIALAVCVCEVVAINLYLRRATHAVSLGDLPIVLGLFFVAPADLVLAVLIGDAIALGLVQRQPAVKLWFNLSRFALEVSLATIVFAAIVAPAHAIGPLGWLAAAAALSASAILGALLVQLAIYLAEGGFGLRELGAVMAFALGASLTNVALGIAGVVVVWRDPTAALLLITPAVVLTVAYRAYRRERRSREQSEQLGRATRAICEAPDAEHAIAALLAHTQAMFGARKAELASLSHEEATTALRASLEPGQPGPLTHVQSIPQAMPCGVRLPASAEACTCPRRPAPRCRRGSARRASRRRSPPRSFTPPASRAGSSSATRSTSWTASRAMT